jgi:hypothetical protein
MDEGTVLQQVALGGRPSDFFVPCCETILQAAEQPESLEDAAKLAFEYTVKDVRDRPRTSDALGTRAWKLMHSHPDIRDFLVAYHATQTIRAAGRRARGSLRDLDYFYPHRIIRFSRDLANSSREAQFEVLEGAKRVHDEGGSAAKALGCYLAGRLQDHDVRHEAGTWLRRCKANVDTRLATGVSMSRTDLLVARTIYISVVCLGDIGASNDYIRLLLEREDWNDINRGFHLEYYDDIPFERDHLLSHHDPLAPFPKTYQSLRGRIVAGLNKPDNALFSVEVYTLFSLAQHREALRTLGARPSKSACGQPPPSVGCQRRPREAGAACGGLTRRRVLGAAEGLPLTRRDDTASGCCASCTRATIRPRPSPRRAAGTGGSRARI